MTYTFWHCGVLIGRSALDHPGREPGQRGGTFHPTDHGLEIFPRLTGILSAGHALRLQLEAKELSPETMAREEIEELLDTSPAGQKILDLGRMLSEIEVRAPDGSRMEFETIGFSDIVELKRFAHEMCPGLPADDALKVPRDARYLVSATFREESGSTAPARSSWRLWSTDN
jgi:hypothetical protein